MKTAIVLFAALAPWISVADFEPGRTRPSAEAEMEAITGDGLFEQVRSARLIELSTDGQGISRYELLLDGKTYDFAVNKSSNGKCGDLYEAMEASGMKLTLRDMSFAECELRAKYTWEAQLVHSEGEQPSHLFLGGEPEHLLLTQQL